MFTQEIAAREGVNERFVRRLIPLAFLSPTIVQPIAEGRHPADLTGEALSRGIEIPLEWAKQNPALGFESLNIQVDESMVGLISDPYYVRQTCLTEVLNLSGNVAKNLRTEGLSGG